MNSSSSTFSGSCFSHVDRRDSGRHNVCVVLVVREVGKRADQLCPDRPDHMLHLSVNIHLWSAPVPFATQDECGSLNIHTHSTHSLTHNFPNSTTLQLFCTIQGGALSGSGPRDSTLQLEALPAAKKTDVEWEFPRDRCVCACACACACVCEWRLYTTSVL
jgi:hypothetical protein